MLGCNTDSSHRGRWHASGHYRAKQLLRLGSLRWRFPAWQQSHDNCGSPDWLLWCNSVIHHVCGECTPLPCSISELRWLKSHPGLSLRLWTDLCPMWSWGATAPLPLLAASPWRLLAPTLRSTLTRPLTSSKKPIASSSHPVSSLQKVREVKCFMYFSLQNFSGIF